MGQHVFVTNDMLQRNPCSPAGVKFLGCSRTHSGQEVSMQDLLPPSSQSAPPLVSPLSACWTLQQWTGLSLPQRRAAEPSPPPTSHPSLHWLLQVWTLAAWHKPALCLPPIALTHIYYSICPDRNSLWSVPVMFCSGSQLPLAQSCYLYMRPEWMLSGEMCVYSMWEVASYMLSLSWRGTIIFVKTDNWSRGQCKKRPIVF